MTNIDWNILIRWLLPTRLRSSFLIAWLRALTSPIRLTLYDKFKGFEVKAWYDLKYQSGQVAHLEFVLNERFDNTLKRIRIGPGSNADNRVYIWLQNEVQPQYLYLQYPENQPLFLFTDAELQGAGGGSYDFTINVPVGLPNEMLTLRAVADRYKRDGKTYIIQTF